MKKENKQILTKITHEYQAKFGTLPELILRSPGRINLIGEHTDYNNGFVLPAAVSQGIYFAIGKSDELNHAWHAMDLNESVNLNSDDIGTKRGDWSDFVLGAWLSMREVNPELGYFNVVFAADLPMGAGMSSSSALTCGVLYGLNALFEIDLPRHELASRAHRVEREFIGLRGGIMDQYASLLSEPNGFLLLDCQDRSHKFIPASDDIYLFLINTNVQRELTTSGYNTRSDECALAVKQISEHVPIQSLRDITLDALTPLEPYIDPIPFKRAKYVLQENERVHMSIEAIEAQDWQALGNLLYAGHEGLRNEFEVSIDELDFLVDYTKPEDWIYGSRMMGGGFGGCTIQVAKHAPTNAFMEQLTLAYFAQFGLKPTIIPVSLTGGTQTLVG